MTLSDERYREIANEAVNDYCDPEGRHLQAAFIHAMRQAVAESHAWRPIETAPKDGTEIWAFCQGEQARMKWITGDGYALWIYADETLQDICPDPESPTHWQPLPQPPETPK